MELVKKLSFAAHRSKSITIYLLAGLLSLLCALIGLNLGNIALLKVPFLYGSDELFYAMTIKSVITTGWYLTNPMIGAPDTHTLVDFPTPETLNYLLIKLISLFSSNWVLIQNVFYLLTFPLITLTSLFVMRNLGLRTPFALTASLLFSLAPYHFMRSTCHLFLSAYYMIPLAVWLAFLVYKDHCFSAHPRGRILSRLPYCIISVLLGSTGVYYAYFACFFLVLAGAIASYRLNKIRPLASAALFIGIITVSVFVNIFPTISYHIQHGNNPQVGHRFISETEVNALKMAQLLLPLDNDRIAPLAKIKQTYNEQNPPNENTMATLGLIGSLGLILLLIRSFHAKRSDNLSLNALSDFNLGGILLATVGGISSLISLFLLPEIRAYNRISIFLAFFALTAFFLALQAYADKKQLKHTGILCLGLLILGIFNQTTSKNSLHNNFAQRRMAFKRDQRFFSKVDKILPARSMVFQLPYLSFPEAPHPYLAPYDHFRAPLHSKHLKWSFGASRGRASDHWQQTIASLPVSEMVIALVDKGFTGLYINRTAYADQGKELERELFLLLQHIPYSNEQASFWDLRPLINTLKID